MHITNTQLTIKRLSLPAIAGHSKVLRSMLAALLAIVFGGGIHLAALVSTGLVVNPSVEKVSATNVNLPASWQKNRWGTNTGSFAYLSGSAQDGSRSLRVTVTAYTSGDAKWYFNPVAVEPGKTYAYQDYYRSNAATNYVAAYTTTAGTQQYKWLGSAPPSQTWKLQTYSIVAPAGVKNVSIYHVIATVGWLETDNTNLNLVDTPAPQPTVALTSPAEGAVVSGAVTLSATATNVSGVQFALDGNPVAGPDTASPYTVNWDSRSVADGSHTLTATGTSASGIAVTATRQILVKNAVIQPPADPLNLVANPGLEQANPSDTTLPAGWQKNTWGNNSATFTYPVAGNASGRGARVDMQAYTDGDAKWYFDPVAVAPNTSYVFSDTYRSNTDSVIFIALTDAAGKTTYQYLGTLPAAVSWQSASFTFTTGAATGKATVFHLLNRVGWLETDTVSLLKAPATDPTNPIANPSLETANGIAPYAWSSNSWGSNTAAFVYDTSGHTGSRSAKVSVSNYVDGDAKWYFDPVALAPGKQYRWSTWYKTNTFPQAVAMYQLSDGTTKFFGMPQPYPAATSATTWTRYSETFTVPNNAVKVSVFMFIKSNGWLAVDDQSISPYTPSPWSRPLVTLTFDDGYEVNVTNALPTMERYGFDSTQCYETTDLQANKAVNDQIVRQFYAAGHEICSHTISHGFLTQMTAAQVDNELKTSKTYLESIIGATVPGFASPYGDYNKAVNGQIMQYYQWHRTVDEGFNSKDNLDRYRLRVQNITPTTTLTQYQAWLDQAKADKTWLIFVYHDVADTNPSPYGSYRTDFEKQMAALRASGITVKPLSAALAEVSAQ